MENYFKIKPYIVPNDLGYGFANAIAWTVQDIYRGAEEAVAYCNLLKIYQQEVPDGSGGTITTNFISPSLMDFQMTIPHPVLNSWGADDTVIDDFVLTYDSNFERE
jgi:hypothetical protein